MMLALGCIQSRHCNTNLCPTGVATQDPTRTKAIDINDKSERVKHFHHNTMRAFYELLGSLGLDNPDKLLPQMIKRRTPYGLQMSVGSLIKPLKENELLQNMPQGNWQIWWQQASSEQFYVYDTAILKPQELASDNKG
jgi:hypothetical protein